MGLKTIICFSVMAVASIGILGAGFLLPMQRVTFTVAKEVKLFEFHTYASSFKIDSENSDACGTRAVARAFISIVGTAWTSTKQGGTFCQWMGQWTETGGDLKDAEALFCFPALDALFPGLCKGLTSAASMGNAVLIAAAIDGVLMLLACVLLQIYIHTKGHNSLFRIGGTVLHILATVVLIGALSAYYFKVLRPLATPGESGGSLWPLEAESGISFSWGFSVLLVAILVQLVMAGLCATFKVKLESIGDVEGNEQEKLASHDKMPPTYDGSYGVPPPAVQQAFPSAPQPLQPMPMQHHFPMGGAPGPVTYQVTQAAMMADPHGGRPLLFTEPAHEMPQLAETAKVGTKAW